MAALLLVPAPPATADEQRQPPNVVLIYTDDQGHSVEERAHFGGGSAGPYRGAKQSLFEGGLRVPAIVSHPARLPKGAVRDQMVHAMDWLPTLAGLCGITLPEDLEPDGRCMIAILDSADAGETHETLYWQFHSGKPGVSLRSTPG